CGRFGHIARVCPNGAAGGAFSARPGRGLNTSALPPIVCFKCGLLNHRAKDCLAPGGDVPTGPAAMNKPKICYRCQNEGHIARDCPEAAEYAQ
ncbi:hypothetical protein EV361DRAFT_792122, partial [Lentinula raphanica]